MSKDSRPVYMGTFEKYKKDVDNRIENLRNENKILNEKIDESRGTFTETYAVLWCVAILGLSLSVLLYFIK